MLIPIPNIDGNYRTGKIPTAKIQYRTTLIYTMSADIYHALRQLILVVMYNTL